jgi:hypothetical protein
MMRYATNAAIAMMRDRIAVSIPDQAEKSGGSQQFDCNE